MEKREGKGTIEGEGGKDSLGEMRDESFQWQALHPNSYIYGIIAHEDPPPHIITA